MSNIWLGTEDSYRQAIAGFQKQEAYQLQHGIKAAGDYSENDTEEEDDLRDYLQIVDGVGIITVSGSLVDETLGWRGRYYGMTGYGDIQRAAVAAVRSPDVSSILLNIKSGGGSVAGLKETAELIANIDKIKPVTTYSSSYMGSAALWLGLAGREVQVSDTAIVGSIGTLIVMTSRYRMLKDNGIDAVVVRSGKYKALGHPAEPMSDEAVALAQEKADYLADMFLGYVAERRKVSKTLADSRFGQGREFIGAQALTVGLVDKISTYPEAFTRTKSLATSDNRSRIFSATMSTNTPDAYNSGKPKGQTSVQHIPTPEELAAMAGIDLQADDADTGAAAGASSEAPAQAATTPVEPSETDKELATIKAELATAIEAMAATQAELVKAKASFEEASAQAKALGDIVAASVKSMAVGLGRTAASAEGIAIAELATKHAEISAEFKAKYRAGGVASSAAKATDSKPAAAATLNPLFIAAATLNKKVI